MTVYKKHRQQIHEGNIMPLGAEPRGFSWTGFQSQKTGGREGYMLVFCEFNENRSASLLLPLMEPGKYRFEHLSGNGKSFDQSVDKDKKVKVSLPEKSNYGFYRYYKIGK